MDLLTVTHETKISSVLSCFDRLIFTGTIPQIYYAQGMTSYLYSNSIRIYDYPKFAESLKNEIRDNAENLARENNVEIVFVANPHLMPINYEKKNKLPRIF